VRTIAGGEQCLGASPHTPKQTVNNNNIPLLCAVHYTSYSHVDMLGLLLPLLLLLLQLFKAAVKWVKHSAALDWLKSRLPQPLVEGVRQLVHRQKRHVRPLVLHNCHHSTVVSPCKQQLLISSLLHCYTVSLCVLHNTCNVQAQRQQQPAREKKNLYTPKSAVTHLSARKFPGATARHVWLVEFYVPWCG
jgi:hypothetical protein